MIYILLFAFIGTFFLFSYSVTTNLYKSLGLRNFSLTMGLFLSLISHVEMGGIILLADSLLNGWNYYGIS